MRHMKAIIRNQRYIRDHGVERWLEDQEADGRRFSEQQRWWLDRIAAAIGLNLDVRPRDFRDGELRDHGGWPAARGVFGERLPALLDELNESLGV